jgi:hypothetical protein
MLAEGHGDITRQGCVECGLLYEVECELLYEVHVDSGRSPWALIFNHERCKA